MEHIGMDLGKKESQIAILTEEGELIEKRIRTEHPRLNEFFGARPRARIRRSEAPTGGWRPARRVRGAGDHEGAAMASLLGEAGVR